VAGSRRIVPRMQAHPGSPGPTVIGVSVGNTRTMVGLLSGGQATDITHQANDPPTQLHADLVRLIEANPDASAVIASVNAPVADRVAAFLQESGVEVYRLGRDFGINIRHSLDDDSTVGQDRLLNAIGAFAQTSQACIVISAGTAVTVDFVDGTGVFHGGAIAPGARMMLQVLHDQTAALPAVEFTRADPARGPFGKDTPHAMVLGATAAITGMVHYLLDRYAEFYEAYPRVIATGGDARTLFATDELVEHIVPELPLIGLAAVCRQAVADGDVDDNDADNP
jgi:type III pantothenate kinase